MEQAIRAAERRGYLRDQPPLPGRRRVRGGVYAKGELIKRLLYVVEQAGLERPETEYPLLGYLIDAAWPAIRLAVEVDDYETHDNRDAMDSDRQRDRRLTIAQWRPIRVTAADIHSGLAEQFVALGVRVASGE